MAETLAVVSLVGGVLGTGVSAIGAYSAAQSQAAQARYQSVVAQNNAIIAGQKATHAAQAGEAAAYDQGLKGRAAVGAVAAQAAASGVDANSGSAADAAVGQREIALLNTERVRDNSLQAVYGYRVEGANFMGESGLLNSKARQLSANAIPAALGTLLSGSSSVASDYLKLQQSAGSSEKSSPWKDVDTSRPWDYGSGVTDF